MGFDQSVHSRSSFKSRASRATSRSRSKRKRKRRGSKWNKSYSTLHDSKDESEEEVEGELEIQRVADDIVANVKVGAPLVEKSPFDKYQLKVSNIDLAKAFSSENRMHEKTELAARSKTIGQNSSAEDNYFLQNHIDS